MYHVPYNLIKCPSLFLDPNIAPRFFLRTNSAIKTFTSIIFFEYFFITESWSYIPVDDFQLSLTDSVSYLAQFSSPSL